MSPRLAVIPNYLVLPSLAECLLLYRVRHLTRSLPCAVTDFVHRHLVPSSRPENGDMAGGRNQCRAG